MTAKGVETLLDKKWHVGNLQWPGRDCILSSNDDVGKQVNAERCTLAGSPHPSTRHFLVIGDSFSAAEFEMYSALSEQGLGSVVATSSWGASPVPEIPNHSPWAQANAYYWTNVIPALTAPLGKGDFLIIINDLSELTPAAMSQETTDLLALLRAGLNRLARDLQQKGVQILFQSQNPLIREAQCTPDMARPQWFNLGAGPSCLHYSKLQTINRIRPLLEVLEDVQGTNPNFHILDLFHALCDEDVCRFYDSKGQFLYRDVFSHPSIEANYLTRPLFLSAVNNAVKESNNIFQAGTLAR